MNVWHLRKSVTLLLLAALLTAFSTCYGAVAFHSVHKGGRDFILEFNHQNNYGRDILTSKDGHKVLGGHLRGKHLRSGDEQADQGRDIAWIAARISALLKPRANALRMADIFISLKPVLSKEAAPEIFYGISYSRKE